MLAPLRFLFQTAPLTGITEIVPYLIGYTQGPAEDVIEALYCTVNVVGSGGTVSAQSPAPFTLVARGTVITITMGGEINSAAGGLNRGLPNYGQRAA